MFEDLAGMPLTAYNPYGKRSLEPGKLSINTVRIVRLRPVDIMPDRVRSFAYP
jgi:hypothetical protein